MTYRIRATIRPAIAPAIRAVAALDDEFRRGMYAFIRKARRPVTREEAAASVGISRKLAAFHLDKLVEADLQSSLPVDALAQEVGVANERAVEKCRLVNVPDTLPHRADRAGLGLTQAGGRIVGRPLKNFDAAV